MNIPPLDIIFHFYPDDTPLRQLLVRHSEQVRDKALQLIENPIAARLPIDRQLVVNGSLLHDIGIGACHAPSILCNGSQPYIAHGIIGAKMLRDFDAALEPIARICERHTGAGLTAQDIRSQGLPLPEQDFLPETIEEKLVCLADKFFSKSGDMLEKPVPKVRQSLVKFGEDTIRRFDDLCRLFGLLDDTAYPPLNRPSAPTN
ncbi:MAG: HDIG domain-containing protein [Victivallales bacterium]|nr:HDIG domain-containing protein [Victivallales bacterium]